MWQDVAKKHVAPTENDNNLWGFLDGDNNLWGFLDGKKHDKNHKKVKECLEK